MVRKGSKPVGGSGQQGLMPDHHPLPSPTGNRSAAKLPSPRLLSACLFSKGLSDPEAAMSSVTIPENRHFSFIGSRLFSERNQKGGPPEIVASGAAAAEGKHHLRANAVARAFSLGILDALGDEGTEGSSCNPRRRMVLFGSKLRVQIPSVSPAGSMEFPNSPIEFGIKNKDSQLALLSPVMRSLGVNMAISATPVFSRNIPASELELSEEYTRVITHGPNPRTIHIFDNCILESSGDGFTCCSEKGREQFPANSVCHPWNELLDHCCACKNHLGQDDDIYIHRGDKAFCSSECRYQEMLLD